MIGMMVLKFVCVVIIAAIVMMGMMRVVKKFDAGDDDEI
jgi:hypothetical protein